MNTALHAAPEELSKFTVPVLKGMCRGKGLKVSGTKAELISRITGAGSGGGDLAASAAAAAESISEMVASFEEPQSNPTLPPATKKKKKKPPGSLLDDDDLFFDFNSGPPVDFSSLIEDREKKLIEDSARYRERKPRVPREGSDGRGRGEGRSVDLESLKLEFGPDGHDYERAEDDETDLDAMVPGGLAKVNELLSQRLVAKLARDFATADGIRDELRGYGVDAHDGSKSWRADGQRHAMDSGGVRRGGERAGGERDGRQQATGRGVYTRTEAREGGDDRHVDDDKVMELIEARTLAKVKGLAYTSLGWSFWRAERSLNFAHLIERASSIFLLVFLWCCTRALSAALEACEGLRPSRRAALPAQRHGC